MDPGDRSALRWALRMKKISAPVAVPATPFEGPTPMEEDAGVASAQILPPPVVGPMRTDEAPIEMEDGPEGRVAASDSPEVAAPDAGRTVIHSAATTLHSNVTPTVDISVCTPLPQAAGGTPPAGTSPEAGVGGAPSSPGRTEVRESAEGTAALEEIIPASPAREVGQSSEGRADAPVEERRGMPEINVEKLKGLLGPLEEQQMGRALQSFDAYEAYVLTGRCLAHYAGLSELLGSQLEQERTANADLVREMDLGEEALKEALEKVDRRDLLIEELRLRVAEVERERSNAQDEVIRLKGKSEEEKGRGENASPQGGFPPTEPLPSTPAAATSSGGALPSPAPERCTILAEISRLRRRLRSFDSKAKQAEEVLKSEEKERSSLRRKLVEQSEQTDSARKRAKGVEKVGVEVVSAACRKSFAVGFNRCKSLLPGYLLTPGTEPPAADPEDEKLRAELNSHVKMFCEGIHLLPSDFLMHRATQTDPEE